LERPQSKINSSFSFWIYIYFLAGAVWHLIEFTRPIVLDLTKYTLFISSLAVIFFSMHKKNLKLIFWILFIFILTIIIEIAGVNSGYIFGEYEYGEILGFKIFNVPLLIGLNWAIVIFGSQSLIDKFLNNNIFLKSFLVSITAVLFDLVLEPTATKLNYWQWQSSSVPLRNYLSWFLISNILSGIGFKLQIKLFNDVVIHYRIAQFIFFLVLLFFL